MAVVSKLSDHLTLPGNVPLGFGNVPSSLLQMVRYRGSVHALLYEQSLSVPNLRPSLRTYPPTILKPTSWLRFVLASSLV
jgi:hypothetical protein